MVQAINFLITSSLKLNSFSFDLLFFFIKLLINSPIARGEAGIERRIKLFRNEFNQTNYRPSRAGEEGTKTSTDLTFYVKGTKMGFE